MPNENENIKPGQQGGQKQPEPAKAPQKRDDDRDIDRDRTGKKEGGTTEEERTGQRGDEPRRGGSTDTEREEMP
jgi:hypothetical protein